MPFISDAHLAEVQQGYAAMRERTRALATRAAARAKEQTDNMITVGETVASAAAFGYVRGKYEVDGSQFVVPGTNIDIQLAVGAAATAAALYGVGAKYDSHLLAFGSGALASYAHDVFRNYGKTGTMNYVGGHRVGAGSRLGAQFGHPELVGAAPMNDVLRSALSASGV